MKAWFKEYVEGVKVCITVLAVGLTSMAIVFGVAGLVVWAVVKLL